MGQTDTENNALVEHLQMGHADGHVVILQLNVTNQ